MERRSKSKSEPPKPTKERFITSVYLGEETKSRKTCYVDVYHSGEQVGRMPGVPLERKKMIQPITSWGCPSKRLAKMTDIKILQEQFEDAAKKFRSLTHLIISLGPVHGLNIQGDYEPTSDNCVDSWMSDDEVHYLLRLEGADWNKKAALRDLSTLAKKGVSWLLDNKDAPGISEVVSATAGLGFGNPVYFWLLAVRHLQSGEITKITGACGGGTRVARDTEPFYSVLEDVFLESALTCGKLLEQTQGKEQPWDEKNPDYMGSEEAAKEAKQTGRKTSAPTLGRKLTPDGQMRYMHKYDSRGKITRSRVHIGDFRKYIETLPLLEDAFSEAAFAGRQSGIIDEKKTQGQLPDINGGCKRLAKKILKQ